LEENLKTLAFGFPTSVFVEAVMACSRVMRLRQYLHLLLHNFNNVLEIPAIHEPDFTAV